MTQPDRLQRALARLILRHPFLATLALRLERVEDPSAGTAWTDGVRLAIDPAWFAELGDDERVGLVAHECYHVALAHHLRRGGRDGARWNRACDYAVNALLHTDGFTLPPDALLDPRFGDAAAEAIYTQLPPEPDDPPAGNGTSPPPPPSPGTGNAAVSPRATGGTGTPPPPADGSAAPPTAGASPAAGIPPPQTPSPAGAGPATSPPGAPDLPPPSRRPEHSRSWTRCEPERRGACL